MQLLSTISKSNSWHWNSLKNQKDSIILALTKRKNSKSLNLMWQVVGYVGLGLKRPSHKNQIWIRKRGQLEKWSTWIYNSWHLINFQNLNLEEGQLEYPINFHNLELGRRSTSIFKIWNSYSQSLNLNLEEGQLKFPINF